MDSNCYSYSAVNRSLVANEAQINYKKTEGQEFLQG